MNRRTLNFRTTPARVCAPCLAWVRVAVGLGLLALGNEGRAATNEHEQNIVYPAGAGVLDVTTAPYNAKGDGKTDDTQAIIQCIDDAKVRKTICYLPNGTYLVSKTLTFKESVKSTRYKAEQNQFVRIQGQNERGVIIRLKDNLGFNGPVLSTIKEGGSNIAFGNRVANLTVDTGSGNPAAIGVRFSSSNGGVLRHVTIRAGKGSDSTGLDLPSTGGPSYLHHLTITGFATGIYLPSHGEMFIEHITLNQQGKAGIIVDGAVGSFRDVVSNSASPVLILNAGQAVLLDSELSGGSNTIAAIDNPGSNQTALLVRNVRTRGYASAIKDKGKNVPGTDVTEYSSQEVRKLWAETPARTLNLPVKETPDIPWHAAATDWAFVDAYGAVGDGKTDDTVAIQKAMNSGKPVVFFLPGKSYKVTQTITIGGAVEHVMFNYALFDKIPLKLNQTLFKVVDGTAPVVLLEEFWNSFEYYTIVEQATRRPLIIRECLARRGAAYRNSVEGGEVFIENVAGGVKGEKGAVPYEFTFKNQKVWARNINPEHHYHVLNDGSLLWAFGFKSESGAAIFTTIHGGLTEVLGGKKWSGGRDTGREQESCIINIDSHVSASLFEEAGGTKASPITTPVLETRGGVTRTLAAAELPRMSIGKRSGGFVLGLYVGYDRAAVDTLLRDKFNLKADK